ncbi:MAG TPA: hypothetical protein VFM56_15350 [Solimonas sp.]|nr:hypothetical protein [Solimonas sp.]
MSKGKARKIEASPNSRAAMATTGGKPKSVQDVLAELPGNASYDLAILGIPEIPESTAFCAVIASYLDGNRPPHLEWEKEHLPFDYKRAVDATDNLACWIAKLKIRREQKAGIEVERQYKKAQNEWRIKQKKLVKLLKEAGDLFESGRLLTGT